MAISKVCVFCASSSKVHPEYFAVANTLGEEFAQNKISIVYGGGGAGLMGELAKSALARGGKVFGIIPKFMFDLEWGLEEATELKQVEDIRERKRLMIEDVDAVVALPGGCGTLEELLEVITLKRLGLFFKPIIIVNTRAYFDPLIEMFNQCIRENFMREKHKAIWSVVVNPEGVIQAIESAPDWDEGARDFATL